jgi:hypothetical protein
VLPGQCQISGNGSSPVRDVHTTNDGTAIGRRTGMSSGVAITGSLGLGGRITELYLTTRRSAP